MKKLFLTMLIAGVCLAQAPRRHNTLTVPYTDSPSASASVLTLQQPATNSRKVQVLWAHINCSVACVVELERNGTAATSTAATEIGTTDITVTPATNAFTDSDVGNGTTIDTFTIAAETTIAVDLTVYNIWLIGDGTDKNLTLRSDSITGTVRMTIGWREF